MTIKERADELTKTLWIVRDSYETFQQFIEKELAAVAAAERETCAEIARAVELQSASLGNAALDAVSESYYHGRGLGAALILARIVRRAEEERHVE